MDDGIRAADADRERVAAALREEMAVGRLTMEEFEDRLSRAYTAKTWAQLRELTTDLPVDIAFEGEVRQAPKPKPEPQPAGGPPARGPGFPWFAPFLLIPLIGMGVAVAHGAFGALIPMAIIVWFVIGGAAHRSRRRSNYRAHYRMR